MCSDVVYNVEHVRLCIGSVHTAKVLSGYQSHEHGAPLVSVRHVVKSNDGGVDHDIRWMGCVPAEEFELLGYTPVTSDGVPYWKHGFESTTDGQYLAVRIVEESWDMGREQMTFKATIVGNGLGWTLKE